MLVALPVERSLIVVLSWLSNVGNIGLETSLKRSVSCGIAASTHVQGIHQEHASLLRQLKDLRGLLDSTKQQQVLETSRIREQHAEEVGRLEAQVRQAQATAATHQASGAQQAQEALERQRRRQQQLLDDKAEALMQLQSLQRQQQDELQGAKSQLQQVRRASRLWAVHHCCS